MKTESEHLAVVVAYELAIDNFCAGKMAPTSVAAPECNSRIEKLNGMFAAFKHEQLEAVAAEIAARPLPVDPHSEWTDYAKRSGLLNYYGTAPEPARAQTAWNAFSFAWNRSYHVNLAPQPVEPVKVHCLTDVCLASQTDGVLCANDECDRESGVRPAEPVKEVSDEVIQTPGGATWVGMPVRAWRWKAPAKNPDMFPPDGMIIHHATHWSTGPKDAERLYRESDIRALLASYGRPAQPAASVDQVAWYTEDHLTDKSATTWDRNVAERWRTKGWPVSSLYTAPVAAQPSVPEGWGLSFAEYVDDRAISIKGPMHQAYAVWEKDAPTVYGFLSAMLAATPPTDKEKS